MNAKSTYNIILYCFVASSVFERGMVEFVFPSLSAILILSIGLSIYSQGANVTFLASRAIF